MSPSVKTRRHVGFKVAREVPPSIRQEFGAEDAGLNACGFTATYCL